MKKFLLATAASFVLSAPGLVAPVHAADLSARPYTKAPPPVTAPALVYNWTGFYIGGHLGGAFTGDNSLQGSDGRFMGGVQGGYDYQFANNWVLGIEANYSWLGLNRRRIFVPRWHSGHATIAALVRSPAGSAMLGDRRCFTPRVVTHSGIESRRKPCGVPQPFSATGNHENGYTVGAGLEYMFSPSWSAKVEYQYYNFGNTTFTGGPRRNFGASFRNDEHTVKAGLNYRFGWGGPAASNY